MQITEWYNVIDDGHAAGDGVTDDTAALQASLDTVAAAPNGLALFPPRSFVTSAPLVIRGGLTIKCGGPLATMGGGGSGVGTFTAGTPGTITGVKRYGSFICPSATWAHGNAIAPAAVVVDASAAEVDKVHIEGLWVDGSNAGLTVCHGIAAYGKVEALHVHGCGVLNLYSTASRGFYMMPSGGGDPVGPCEPQGTLMRSCLAQNIGSHGVEGVFSDGTIETVHTQVTGGNGIYIHSTNARGGNIRLLNCRADLADANGFCLGVPSGGYLGMIQADNCSTQRNANNGFKIAGAAGAKVCPVYLSNCVAQGDGHAGSNNGGYRLSGPVMAFLSNCAVHVNTVDVHSGAPNYAIIAAGDGLGPPICVGITGGFFNAVQAFCKQIDAPAASTIGAYAFIGRQWNNDIPSWVTTL